jgi:hypothetical protein
MRTLIITLIIATTAYAQAPLDAEAKAAQVAEMRATRRAEMALRRDWPALLRILDLDLRIGAEKDDKERERLTLERAELVAKYLERKR